MQILLFFFSLVLVKKRKTRREERKRPILEMSLFHFQHARCVTMQSVLAFIKEGGDSCRRRRCDRRGGLKALSRTRRKRNISLPLGDGHVESYEMSKMAMAVQLMQGTRPSSSPPLYASCYVNKWREEWKKKKKKKLDHLRSLFGIETWYVREPVEDDSAIPRPASFFFSFVEGHSNHGSSRTLYKEKKWPHPRALAQALAH